MRNGWQCRLSGWRAVTAAMALAVVSSWASADAAPKRFDPFTVEGVSVDVTAASAAAARDQAIVEGEQQGFRTLLERLTLANDRPRLPKVSATRLPELVQGFEVAHERRSGVRYLADYTIHFRAEAVRQLLRQAGVSFAETASKPVVVLAVLVQGDHPVLWDDPNPWRDAWLHAKPHGGLVPLIQPLGELEDVTAIDTDAASHGAADKLQAIAHRYGDADVLVTEATLKAGAAYALDISTTRFAPGQGGNEQTWVLSIPASPGESDGELMARAVTEVIGQVEEAWKAANTLDFRQSGTLIARVPAATLREWLQVRDRLAGIPAVRASRLVSLGRDGARVEIRYVGDPGQLRLALAQRDLDLEGNEPDWVLQRHSAGETR
jgi:Uncharacterized protein conserved in bacteria (DUF2066)